MGQPAPNPIRNLFQEYLQPAWNDLRAGNAWLMGVVADAVGWLADFFLSFRRWSAWIRWTILCLAGALIWALFAMMAREGSFGKFDPGLVQAQVKYVTCTARAALTSDPQSNAKDQRCYRFLLGRTFTFRPLVYEIPFQLLFAPNIFRHVLLAGFAVWLALKFAARYLSEIYELPDNACGEHHILQSALVNPYNLMIIQEGFVPKNQQHLPIYLVGGPGRVLVNLENAALFEDRSGVARVLGPTVNQPGVMAWLDGFERLRSMIDLRDQREEFDIPGRSQDGIRVTAKNIQVVYSVFRDHQQPTYERPYPFEDPNAIENLVYRQGRGPWTIALAVQIRGELFDFFAKHPLNEFLSLIETPEIRNIIRQEIDLLRNAQRLTGTVEEIEEVTPGRIQGLDFVPRPDITAGFYRSAEERGQARGTQIDWVGVGTWHFPAQIVLGRHQEAWKITHDNQIKTRPVVLNTLRRQQRLIELLRLIQNVPISTFRTLTQTPDLPQDDVLRGLILAYHHQMNEALDDYEREIGIVDQDIANAANDMDRDALIDRRQELFEERATIEQVLQYLSRFTGVWLGDLAR